MSYSHTQHAPLHFLFWAVIAVVATAAVLSVPDLMGRVILGFVIGLLLLLDVSFQHLTVANYGDRLSVRFGPLPLLGTSVRYDQITRVESSRSKLIDGWCIHWGPGRGWTYNLWGYDCVELHHQGGLLRIGTDDRENLTAFLSGKLAEAGR